MTPQASGIGRTIAAAVALPLAMAVPMSAHGAPGTQAPAVANSVPHAGAPDDRLSFLYETDDGVRSILAGSEAMRAVPWIFRIEPSTSGDGARLAGGDAQRMLKLNGKALSQQPSAGAMAQVLRQTVDRWCPTPAHQAGTCQAHRVLIDEIGSYFGGRNGKPSVAGKRLSVAMRTLAGEPTPWGGSYASRIIFALAPGPATSVTAGFGANRSLGRNGKAIRRNYRDVFQAMSYGGGVWIEDFHYIGRTMTGFTAKEWQTVPVGVTSFLGKVRPDRDPLTYTHILFGNTTRSPSSCGGATWTTPRFSTSRAYAKREKARFAQDDSVMKRANAMNAAEGITPVAPVGISPSMDCELQLAQGNPTNLRLMANGPAAYRLPTASATAWGDWFRRFFLAQA